MKSIPPTLLLASAFLLASCEKEEPSARAGTPTVKPASKLANLSRREPGKRQEEGYVLARRFFLPVKGQIRTDESSTELKELPMTISARGQEMTGSLTSSEQTVETYEATSGSTARRILTSHSNKSTMTLNGEEQVTPEQADPLLEVPVTLTLKDDRWSVGLESGTPSAEQTSAIAQLIASVKGGEDYVLYGETPRKPGDKWTVDTNALRNYGGLQSVEGSFTVEFVELTQFQGSECAVLKSEFTLSGVASMSGMEMKMSFTGTNLSYRSLVDLIDVESTRSGEISFEGSGGDGTKIQASGPFSMVIRTSVR